MLNDRLPPHDIQAEEAVIGSLLIDGETIHRVKHIISPDDFYRQANRHVYTACLAIADRGGAIDQVTVAHELEAGDILHEVGGSAFLAHTVGVVPTSVHAEHFANIVYRTSVCRQLIHAADIIRDIGYDNSHDVEETFNDVTATITAIPRRHKARVSPMSEIVEDYREEIERELKEGVSLSTVPTGLIDLDETLGGGLRAGDLYTVAARASMGKSQFVMNLIYKAALSGRQVVNLSSEETGRAVLERLAGIRLGYSFTSLRKELKRDRRRDIMEAIDFCRDLPIHTTRTAEFSSAQARTFVEDVAMRFGPVDLVTVDYVQALTEVARSRDERRDQLIGRSMRTFKALAESIESPVVVAAQLNRRVEERGGNYIPRMSDLRESGDIEQDSDVVILLRHLDHYVRRGMFEADRPEAKANKNVLDLYVAKNRKGPTGQTGVFYNPAKAVIENLTSRQTPAQIIQDRHDEWARQAASNPEPANEEVTQLDLNAPVGVNAETGEVTSG